MTDTISQDLKNAIAVVVAAEQKLPPEYQATFHQALVDVARLIEQEIDGEIKVQAAKVPLFGGMIASFITSAVNKAIDTGVADLSPPSTPGVTT